MKILLLAVLATAALAQNSFQNTRFDIPVDLPVEDPSVLAQIEGVPNHHVKNELKPVKIKKTINEINTKVAAPQPAAPQPAQPQPAPQVHVAPTPAPLFPGLPQFQFPGLPALTLPGFAPPPTPQGAAHPAPPPNAPVPTADDYDQSVDIPTAIKPTTRAPGNRKNKHKNHQPATTTSQPATVPTTTAPLVLVQSQGPSTLPPTFGQQPYNNQFYQQYNQQYQQYQQQYLQQQHQLQQQQQLQAQFGQQVQQPPQAQVPTFGQQPVQTFTQQPAVLQQQNFQQRPPNFQPPTLAQQPPQTQYFHHPQVQPQTTFISPPPPAPAATPLPTPAVQQPPFAQFGAPTQGIPHPVSNQQLSVSPPQFAQGAMVVQPLAERQPVKPVDNVDHGSAITPSRASIWFKEQTDLTSCRADINNIAEKFKNKFPVYLRNGGKDADLAELVQQRISECDKKSSAGHWEKVDGLLTKISLSKSEEDECRAGLVQERISCDNLMSYTCQFIAPGYPFRLVPARITIQEARQAESGAEKCRKVVRLVKKRLES